MATAHDVYKLIRSATLDVDGTVYTDDILLPALQAAARELSAELASRGYEKTEDVVVLDLGIGVTALGEATTPPLPADFVAPQRVWEKPTGGTTKYVPMYRVGAVPDIDRTDTLKYWQWEDGELRLVGATVPTTLLIEYLKSIIPITSSGSNIDAITNSLNYLAYKALTLVGLGRADADVLNAAAKMAEKSLDLILDTYTTADQFAVVRRSPYGITHSGDD